MQHHSSPKEGPRCLLPGAVLQSTVEQGRSLGLPRAPYVQGLGDRHPRRIVARLLFPPRQVRMRMRTLMMTGHLGTLTTLSLVRCRVLLLSRRHRESPARYSCGVWLMFYLTHKIKRLTCCLWFLFRLIRLHLLAVVVVVPVTTQTLETSTVLTRSRGGTVV